MKKQLYIEKSLYSVHFFEHILIPRIPRPWASGDPLPGRGTYQGHSIAVPNVWLPSAVTSGSPGSAAGPQWRGASEAPGGGTPSFGSWARLGLGIRPSWGTAPVGSAASRGQPAAATMVRMLPRVARRKQDA